MLKCYDLSGPSGVRPCLYCLATNTGIQTCTSTKQRERTLQGLTEDYSSFVASGSTLQNIKFHSNVIRPYIVPIEVSNVCVPVLPLDMGIYSWLFEAMVQDAENINLAPAKSALDIQSSTSFNGVAELLPNRTSYIRLQKK